MVKVSLRKKVKFRLEGEVPPISPHQQQKTQMQNRLEGFTTPQLPRPGERVSRISALRIEKYVHGCVGMQPFRILSLSLLISLLPISLSVPLYLPPPLSLSLSFSHSPRLPRSLANTPLKAGDEILEINGIVIINQDQKEVHERGR